MTTSKDRVLVLGGKIRLDSVFFFFVFVTHVNVWPFRAGCGFIGRHIVEYLVDNNLASVIRVVDKVPPQIAWLNDRHKAAFESPSVEFHSANLIHQSKRYTFMNNTMECFGKQFFSVFFQVLVITRLTAVLTTPLTVLEKLVSICPTPFTKRGSLNLAWTVHAPLPSSVLDAMLKYRRASWPLAAIKDRSRKTIKSHHLRLLQNTNVMWKKKSKKF